jgi:UDP-N-acetylmuramate: L-alanyl-gamma-D-glutamyl-meso-diaminopimelate ligase
MKVHFIFICGSGVSQMAVLMKNLGHTVTGSDTDIFPPVSTYLENNGIHLKSEISASNITDDIDLVVLGGSTFIKVKDKFNPEYEEAKRLGIKCVGWDELVGEMLATNTTVEVAGTYGKSTCTAMLAWVLDAAGLNPNFMVGAIPLNFSTGFRKGETDYCVLEGDEHPLLHYHEGGKFMYHKPTHALITAAKWDHINVYTTPESYIQAYQDLVRLLSGFVIANLDGENIKEVIKDSKVKVKFYTVYEEHIEIYKELKKEFPDIVDGLYIAKNLFYEKDKTSFTVDFVDYPRNENWKIPDQMMFETELIGEHNVQNCLGVISTALSLGVNLSGIQEGIKTFKNVKRRLEIVGKTKNGALVFDDLAHSPVKAKETLRALRTRYKSNRIVAIFDPHSSLLKEREVLSWLPGTFDLASEVIIPKVTIGKDVPKEKRVFGKDIVDAISITQPEVKYMPIDDLMIQHLQSSTKTGDIIIFMSSGGWRNILTSLISN